MTAARRSTSLPGGLSPRGLARDEAATYVGISPNKFDEMVDDGRMPKAKRVDGRKVWDRQALDIAFEALPDDGNAANDEVWRRAAV